MNKGEHTGHSVDMMFEELFCGRMGSLLFVLECRANGVERVPRRHIWLMIKKNAVPSSPPTEL